MRSRSIWKLGATLLAAMMTLTACASGDPAAQNTEVTVTEAETVVETAEPAPAPTREGPFSIGVSNAFVASEYRTQMIEGIEEAYQEYHDQGILDRLVMENADADINGQIQQIRNLINQGVDAIIVNPNSATALNAVFQEAMDQGILVYAVDQAVETPGVRNVTISQQDLGAMSAEWFAQKVGDGARIVTVEGAAGNPARDARWAGAEPIFAAHNIEVVTRGDGGWDQATGQTVATDLIATHPDIDGIWTYDGMAQGVMRAVQAADRLNDLVIGGEARGGFMQMWNDVYDTGFETIGVINPPAVGAIALRIAVRELQGESMNPDSLVDGNVVVPLSEPITRDNFQQAFDLVRDRPDSYIMDSPMTSEEVDSTFFSH